MTVVRCRIGQNIKRFLWQRSHLHIHNISQILFLNTHHGLSVVFNAAMKALMSLLQKRVFLYSGQYGIFGSEFVFAYNK